MFGKKGKAGTRPDVPVVHKGAIKAPRDASVGEGPVKFAKNPSGSKSNDSRRAK
jgi:hypothetical protein